jgi:hypothetical protein
MFCKGHCNLLVAPQGESPLYAPPPFYRSRRFSRYHSNHIARRTGRGVISSREKWGFFGLSSQKVWRWTHPNGLDLFFKSRRRGAIRSRDDMFSDCLFLSIHNTSLLFAAGLVGDNARLGKRNLHGGGLALGGRLESSLLFHFRYDPATWMTNSGLFLSSWHSRRWTATSHFGSLLRIGRGGGGAWSTIIVRKWFRTSLDSATRILDCDFLFPIGNASSYLGLIAARFSWGVALLGGIRGCH